MATTTEKPVILVGVDDSEHSFYALNWAIDQFFVPFASNPPFKLLLVHAKRPAYNSIASVGAPGIIAVLPNLEKERMRIVAKTVEMAKEICRSKSVDDVIMEVVEGDSKTVLCEAAEKHRATIMVVSNHGGGGIKRAVLGSVSDYCARHAHCTVMIVKEPKN